MKLVLELAVKYLKGSLVETQKNLGIMFISLANY